MPSRNGQEADPGLKLFSSNSGLKGKLGWIAVGISILISCTWAAWGIIENFHEGWYYPSLGMNLGLMAAQYLSPMLLFIGLTMLGIYRPRISAGFHFLAAGLAAWFFKTGSAAASTLIISPLLVLGLLYWFGRLDNSKLAARLVEGNGVNLIWSPDGPGWPDKGGTWLEASRICQRLDNDGLILTDKPQDIWRLPTVEEAVLSLTRAGENSGGNWDPGSAQASYLVRPDKESPLWKVHSPVIYWWTATEIDGDRAYIIVYDGKVWPRSKDFGPDYLGFRCVKTP